MTLTNFLSTHDRPGAIILLEGKRAVAEKDRPKLFALGRLLAERSTEMIFRSGNAPGSDEYFSEGVASVDKIRLQVITPYTGHRRVQNQAYKTYALDTIDLLSEPEVVYHSKHNIRNSGMVDLYLAGSKGMASAKAAYLIRDTIKVVGTSELPRASFGIFYDDLKAPMTGGTGHTMQVCVENRVPYINQRVWSGWFNAAGPYPSAAGDRDGFQPPT